ncbi:hypothetical protein DL766_007130 [Monosporascus sp. MC13-8B]|nr:hypothetical protein DL766_007130 [Monosporascus sp. MC13-8B]
MSGPELDGVSAPVATVENGGNGHDRADDNSRDNVSNNQREPQSKPPPRKRRRLVISCTECHRRKQKSRNKEAACQYETGNPIRKDSRNGSTKSDEGRSPETHENAPHKAVDFGYTRNGNSSLDMLGKIDGAGESLAGIGVDAYDGDSAGVRERYKSLVRQLPARTYVDQLVEIYFRDINWQYCGLDMPILQELMDQWYNLPFRVLSSTGPQALDPMLRALPALLFQLMASALLYLPDTAHSTFNSLKYANMTFDDLALDYSESGVAILSLLGKRQMSVVTVLAGWVRAGFLKYTGQVTEAWHQVGTAIRDAQEIGLHRDQYDPQLTAGDSTETVLDKLWMAQFRRRVWMTLLGWDLHTGAVLGRPTSVDYRLLNRSLPIDVVMPNDSKKMPLVPRGEGDPPTPLTRAIWAFKMIRPLRDILDLEKEGPFPKDFSKVDKLHQHLLEVQANTPAPFRQENPDTRFDNLPECWWLPLVRPSLPQIAAFNFMALHRPYIFTRAASRREALRASVAMLESQRSYFSMLRPHQFKAFALFFGTFDAVVMVASIYILFPREHPEVLPSAVRHFRWAVERFELMAPRNRLASAALGVLNAIYIRFRKAVGPFFSFDDHGMVCKSLEPASSSASDSHTPNSDNASLLQGSGSSTTAQTTIPSDGGSSAGPTPAPAPGSGPDGNNSADHNQTDNISNDNMFATPGWSFPPDFDLSTLTPMYPMSDLAYNDLTGVLLTNHNGGSSSANQNAQLNPAAWSSDTLPPATATATGTPAAGGADGAGGNGIGGGLLAQVLEHDNGHGQPWQFGGDFGDDTIWNLLNQLPPY